MEVTWVDIYEDATGNPDKAALAKRVSLGRLWGHKEDKGMHCFVTTTTVDEDDHTQSGLCIYPDCCILDVKVIKKVRRPRLRLPVKRNTEVVTISEPEPGPTKGM